VRCGHDLPQRSPFGLSKVPGAGGLRTGHCLHQHVHGPGVRHQAGEGRGVVHVADHQVDPAAARVGAVGEQGPGPTFVADQGAHGFAGRGEGAGGWCSDEAGGTDDSDHDGISLNR